MNDEAPNANGGRILTLAVTLGLVACGPSGDTPPNGTGALDSPEQQIAERVGYTDITVEDLGAMLAGENGPVLVNVYVPYAGDIPGTDLSIPFDQIGARAGEIPRDRDSSIVVYCRSGHMSAQAARTLASLGYTRVYNLTGGMNAWRDAGY